MQKVQDERQKTLNSLAGRRIASATSSLTSFAIKFSDETGAIFDAVEMANPGVMSPIVAAKPGALSPAVAVKEVTADQIPPLEEAVCSVDWGWIVGSTIQSVEADGGSVRLKLKPAGPLAIACALWQGKPFLSFQPYKPANK